MRALLTPASERSKLAGQYARELLALPFDFSLSLHSLGPKVLAETLMALRPMKLMKRRDLVGQGAGWAPTEAETWCFNSEKDLRTVIEARQVATRGNLRSSSPLLFCTCLKVDASQQLAGLLWTSSVGTEWAYGPAADPLQLGLRLGFQDEGQVKIDLDIGSGAWTPWAEHWTFEEDTLTACVSIAAALPDGSMSVIRTKISEESHSELQGGDAASQGAGCLQGWASETQGSELLRQALVSEGAAGIRTIVSISSICWRKEPPEWCPEEVQRVVVNRAHAGLDGAWQ
jgi:hypothetical protein